MSSVREKLVNVKHKSKFLTYLWYLYRQPQFKKEEKKLAHETELRREGKQDERYCRIKEYKGIHSGERCFIIATGLSLTIHDLELLKNECTFGMNSICKLYNQTDWRPTYYGVQDANIYEKMEKELSSCYGDKNNLFVSSSISEKFDTPKCWTVFPYDFAYHDNQLEIEKYFAEFSDNSYAIVYDGYSITYSLIEIAVYMGFKEIYLLGTDCSYKRGAKNHIVESGNDDKNEEKNYEKMVVGYQCAKEYADGHGIKIVNCTRGGMLEVFSRENLEDVLARK